MRKIKQIFESVRQKLFLDGSLTLKSARLLYLIPIAGLIITTLTFGAIIYVSSEKSTFAAPGGTSSDTVTLSQSMSTSTINFNFNESETRASAYKTQRLNVQLRTNGRTGFNTTLSSVDEGTSLISTDSANTQSIESTNGLVLVLGPKTWGYRARASNGPSSYRYLPIPKSSTPDTIISTRNSLPVDLQVDFGVKVSPDLNAGTYTKRIVITTVTNYVPTSAVFLPGNQFNGIIRTLNPNNDTEVLKRSLTPPPSAATVKLVSATGQGVDVRPIKAWYDSSQKTIFWWTDADSVFYNENSSGMFQDINNNVNHMQLIDMSGVSAKYVRYPNFMFANNKKLVKHIVPGDFSVNNIESTAYMFYVKEAENPIEVDPLDLSNFDTSKVTAMTAMFEGSYYPSINLSSFNTSNTTTMLVMFKNAKKLTSLNLSNFDTSKVTTMESMFEGCRSISNLDLTSFNTANVTNMSQMFMDMDSLNSINLASFNTSSVTLMYKMFFMTSANPPITNLDLSSFNTSNVTNMERMFVGLANLQNLNVSSFDTCNVYNMEAMFYYTFVTHPNGVLDISNFNTSRVDKMNGMFNYMKVKTIYASPNFVTSSLFQQPSNIFMDNNYLTGGNGTTYAWPNYTSNFAHIDAPGNPGYFTQKP